MIVASRQLVLRDKASLLRNTRLHFGCAGNFIYTKDLTSRIKNMSSTTSRPNLLEPFQSNVHPDVKIPKLIYGTAWKKERTAELVYQAIKNGFRAIDTAAQPRHYQEHLVGQGIKRAIDEGLVTRGDLHIQTKFTPPSGQDPNNMPYSASDLLSKQIESSLLSSLANFTFSDSEDPYIDTLIIHSPLRTTLDTLEALYALSQYVPHPIRSLGMSNTYDVALLRDLVEQSETPPIVVQNRFYPDTRHDVQLRKFCRQHNVLYQSFWTLTGNPALLGYPPVVKLAGKLLEKGLVSTQKDGKSLALYSFVALGLDGISILDGTTSEVHMSGDIEGLEKIAGLIREGGQWNEEWQGMVKEFRGVIEEVD